MRSNFLLPNAGGRVYIGTLSRAAPNAALVPKGIRGHAHIARLCRAERAHRGGSARRRRARARSRNRRRRARSRAVALRRRRVDAQGVHARLHRARAPLRRRQAGRRALLDLSPLRGNAPDAAKQLGLVLAARLAIERAQLGQTLRDPRLEAAVGRLVPAHLGHALGEVALAGRIRPRFRSEEHTSELQSRRDLVCRLLLEKKKKKTKKKKHQIKNKISI